MRLVLPGRAITYLGDSLALVVLSLEISSTGEPLRMSMLLAAFSLPLFLFAGVAGRVVDEFDSRLLLVTAGFLQVGASIGLILTPTFPWLLVFVALLQVGQSITGPTWGALVPRIVGHDLLGVAVGTQQALSATAGLAGAGLAGVLYDLIGYEATLVFTTGMFAVTIGVGALVHTRRGRRYYRIERDQDNQVGGWHYIAREPVLALLVPAMWAFILVAEATNVVEIFLVRNEVGASASSYGLLSALSMAGAIAGPFLAGRVHNDHTRILWATVAGALIALTTIALGLAQTVWMLIVIFAFGGLAAGAINSLLATVIVVRTAENVRGRVLSTLNGIGRGFSVLAMTLGGIAG